MPLNFTDRTDFDNAERGLIAPLERSLVTSSRGRVVWDPGAYEFLTGDCPPTVNPSLWRQGQLCAVGGLFAVADGIYQVRALDISNMTIVEGERGIIVIDPLVSPETAATALALYSAHRGARPVTGVIYTHSHVDHFGGVGGVLPDGAGDVPILAPIGFLEHAVAENVYAGTAMIRRAAYMYGQTLERGPTGHVGCGLGLAPSLGRPGLLAPTRDITQTGQTEAIDGVTMVFQLTPGTEAPAEMNFFFPQHGALCMAENATHNMHNLLTLRGALVRDPRLWSGYLNEAIELFGADADVAFASHHWPTWGAAAIVEYLREQRDLYAYLHDQTLRRINRGETGVEIAETFELSPGLDAAWHARGYYGSVSHNVKAIYQRYMGWFDGHPSSLWPHPPEAAAARYVEVIGGQEAVLDKAKAYAGVGDLRFAAELLKHAVFADPTDTAAREELASVYEQLAYGAENAVWRYFYLTGATELREGAPRRGAIDSSSEMTSALTIEQLFAAMAIRVDGRRAADVAIVIDWHFRDTSTTVRLELSNGALIQTANPTRPADVDLRLTLTKAQLLGVLAGAGTDGIDTTGDLGALDRLLGLLDRPDPSFAIVTP
jgi:alkyl sulfatase BDS1-like metallo-beta-lactamase superfamily hydrolase